VISDWSETPFRLASANMRAELLSVPELRDYLRYNADFPQALLAPFATYLQYRFAVPWHCFVAVLLAAPLAISFSRSGMLSNVATAIGLVFLHIFVATHFLRPFGEGDRIAPWLAVWTPNILFTCIGLALLYLRSTNRELRDLNPFATRPVIAA
jgi:lipopolysaccharide export system permease protein